MAITDFIHERLEERSKEHLLRKLTSPNNLIDFCSNDYLGFSRSPELKTLIDAGLADTADYPIGSTGSRLISGNSLFAEQLEEEIAGFHHAEAGLLYNSGYDANVGLFSCLAQRGDTLITDELIHASIIDGARLSYANRYTFRHNDLNSLHEKLKAAKGNIYIGVESIYSMDGDEAPLKAIAHLAAEYGAALIVDEAHATGVTGPWGRGLVCKYNLEDKVFARVITFGKALGSHGAIVLGNNALRSYLINFSRPFIYSTAAPLHTLMCVKEAYNYLQSADHPALIRQRINVFKESIQEIFERFIPSDSPIQSMLIGGNAETRKAAKVLTDAGYHIKPILSPTVPVGKERLRVCLHTFNSSEEIEGLVAILKKL